MYIRIKDGIYEVLSEYDTPENTTLISNPVAAFDVKVTPRTYSGTSIRIIYSNEVISKSENLEELCDEFVLYDNQLKTFGVFDKKVITFKWLQNNLEIYKGMIIYGAIYTDKGLIYVAKMDNEGKLVLI